MTDGALVRLVFHELETSEGFAGWLEETGCSIAVTIGNRLLLIGLRPDGSVGSSEREYGGAAALAADGLDGLYLATRYQIWRLQDALPAGDLTPDGHDRLLLPQTAWTTGRLDVRQLVVDPRGGLVFASSRFSCLATLDERLNFAPVWMPPFVSALVPEERCFLSGVALAEDGRPAFATCAARSDTVTGWREHRRDGGLVLAVGGDVVAAGLSLPHSPVLRGGRLWLAHGGAGELGVIEPGDGVYACVAALPGFARGLALGDRHAIVGVSRPPRGETFDGLPLAGRLDVDTACCAVYVVDLDTGAIAHRALLHGVGPEISDVALLRQTRWPTAVEVAGEDAERSVTMPC